MDQLIERAINRIHKGDKGIDPDLFAITSDTMEQAINRSVKLKYNVKNQAFINQLKTSSKVFAAFKNHHQSKALTALLVDKDGNVVSFSQFKKEALKVTGKYNKVWLKTEYNTALRRGRIGSKFQKFKEDERHFPNLRWIPSTAAEPRSSHIPYYGMVLPINHPFWVNQFPENEWNCKCDVEQTRAKADESPSNLPTPPKGLEGNPAFTGSLIGSKHPYFKGLNAVEKQQVTAVVQKDTNRTVNAWARDNIDEKNGLSIQSKQIQTGKVLLLQKDVKNLLKRQDDAFIKTYVTVLNNDVKNWKYIGFEKANRTVFTYYETNYGDTVVYVKMKVNGDLEQPYSINTKIDNSIIIKEGIPQ